MRLSVISACALGFLLSACGTNTKGSWACSADKGATCASIESLDYAERAPTPRTQKATPLVDGAGPVRWWSASDAVSGDFPNAPRRESDQYVKVMVAGWVDAAGDYHAPSEVYAVMRRGGWWTGPAVSPLVSSPKVAATPTTKAQARAAISAPSASLETASTPDTAVDAATSPGT